MTKPSIHEFQDLEGIKKQKISGVFASNITQARKYLGKWRVISWAGSGGAVTAWRDDKGKYKASHQYYMVEKASKTCTTKKEILDWYAKYLKKCKI